VSESDGHRRPADGPADLVLRGGRVVTLDGTGRDAEAVAVAGGRIAAIGPSRDVDRWIGPRTRVIELAGRMACPAFIDAHVHPIHGCLARRRCDLHGITGGAPAVLEAVAAYAARAHDQDWVLGGGWALADFPGGTPAATDLDGIVADRPAFLTNRDGHGAWANSRALGLAGIRRYTPDPPDGRIERLPDGRPQGTLHEGAMALVADLAPPPSTEDYVGGLEEAQRYLHSLGITGWQDAWVEAADDAAYATLAERGGLTARVVGAWWWDRSRGLDQLADILAWRERGPVGRYRRTSVKLMLDGICENFTAALGAPYLDAAGEPTGVSGLDFIEPTLLAAAVSAIDAAGLQPHFHAIGDRAVRHALDAVEAARVANERSDSRPHIAHLQVIHPDDIPRFGALGVTANCQTLWACHEPQMDTLTLPFLGPERAGWQYPFASLERAGATLAMGSDWPVSTPGPLRQLEVAVTRVADDGRGERPPFLPSERLAVRSALAGFTRGSAYANHLDAVNGSLEPGKLADIVVLDRDPLAPDGGPLGDARVVLTLIDGQPVHEDPSLGG
jgi:predicted amidohydrolase YtcJ